MRVRTLRAVPCRILFSTRPQVPTRPRCRYPCFYQPDAKLDWCRPVLLTDAVCESLDRDPTLPALSIGYVHLLHGLATAANSPPTLSLAFPSPCALGAVRAYETRFHEYNKLVINTDYDPEAFFGKSAIGSSPIGFRSPLMETGTLARAGHAVCINLRGEVYAAAQERTMLEITHCCGTMDYMDGYQNFITKKDETNEMTCLTLKGMIKIFCEYIESIVPAGFNLVKSFPLSVGNLYYYSPVVGDIIAHALDDVDYKVKNPITYLSFGFLESKAACMSKVSWEDPRIIISFTRTRSAPKLSFTRPRHSGPARFGREMIRPMFLRRWT